MVRPSDLDGHPAVDQWDLCKRIERDRGPEGGVPSFTTIKRDLENEHGLETTVTTLKTYVNDYADVSAVGARLLRAQLYGDVYGNSLEDVREDISPVDLATILPDRPLTETEVHVLVSHPEVDAVHGEPLGHWYPSMPEEFEDDLHTLWVESGNELVMSFLIEERGKRDTYTPSMNLDQPMGWEQKRVRRSDSGLALLEGPWTPTAVIRTAVTFHSVVGTWVNWARAVSDSEIAIIGQHCGK